MWFAAVCSLMKSSAPISRLESPRATSRRISSSRSGEPGRDAERRPPGRELRIAAVQRRQAEPVRERARLGEHRGGALGLSVAERAAARTRSAVCASHVSRSHAPVQRERRLEVALGALGVAEGRGEHAEVPVARAVAGDAVADHHVRPGERLELGIEELGGVAVADRARRVGQVGERRDPEALRGTASSPSSRTSASSRRASSCMPSSASSAARPGRHALPPRSSVARMRITGASSASRPCSRRIPNIWIP